MKYKPLFTQVLIKPITEKQSAGGIYLPEKGRNVPTRGEVMAVGDGQYLPDGTVVPIPFAVGDRVLYRKWVGTEVKQEQGEAWLMLEQKDVLAVVEQ